MTLDDLLLWAYEMKIEVKYKNLRKKHPDLLGVADAGKMLIRLDKSLRLLPRMHKCVLAEEIGHILYPPRPGHLAYHSTAYANYDSGDRSNFKIIVAQDERKALAWATSVLIPDVEFNRAIEKGVTTLYELADYFDVEEWFLRLKIGYFRMKARDEGKKLKWRDIIKRC